MARAEVVNEEVKPGKLKPQHIEAVKEILKNNPEKTVEDLVSSVRDFLNSKNAKILGVTPVYTPYEGVEIHVIAGSYTYARKKNV
jgi:hypothetical protein